MDGSTIIEVVAIHEKTKKVYVSEMSYAEWIAMDKKENYIYTAFQKGKQRFNVLQLNEVAYSTTKYY